MELNAAQNKFIQDLRQMLPLYKGSADARLKTPATNLEWNLKKLTGEFSGDSLDGVTFAQRTKADLELIAASLTTGAAGQAYAVRGAGEVAAVFGAASSAPAGGAVSAASQPAPSVAVAASSSAPAATPAAAAGRAATAASNGTAGAAVTDINAVLGQKAADAGEKLAWKTSVVDLLKLLGKDSGQAARHRYAVALGFPEKEISNMPSAEFNTWLHGQLLATLAHNGGSLPSNIA